MERHDLEATLSAAERQVVQLVSRGWTNNEVAAALGRSPKTIEWTLSNVYRKLGVRSRTELVARLLARPADAGARPGISPGAPVSPSSP